MAESKDLTIAQELGQRVSQFEAALAGSGISPKKFVRVIMTAVALNPELLNCNRRSLMNAAMKAASDGLVPDGHDGALVAFDGQVTWMPMVAGVRKKVRRSGEVTAWDVTAVFQKDAFDYELGDSPFIKHKPWMAPELFRPDDETDADYTKRLRQHLDHGQLTHVYSIAMIKGGDKSRDVMTRAEVELVRDMYARKNRKGEFSPAWRKSFPEMAKKTVARRHAKQLPMSSDILGLLSRDDELYDLERDRADRVQAPRVLSDRLDFLVGVDPETGEFESDDGVASRAPSQRDGVSTPPSHSAAPDDGDGVGTETEGAAHSSFAESGASNPLAPDAGDQGAPRSSVVTPEPDQPQSSGSQAPPGAAKTPSQAPGGTSRKRADHGALGLTIEQRGEATAMKGRSELEKWVNELPPDEMAKISLAQLKAWRNVADKVAAT
jgi:recombination protein RecT